MNTSLVVADPTPEHIKDLQEKSKTKQAAYAESRRQYCRERGLPWEQLKKGERG